MIQTLTKIFEKLKLVSFPMGIFIYAGVDSYGEEIFEIIEPLVEIDFFYYNCGNKFNTQFVNKYFIDDIKMMYDMINHQPD